MFEGYSGGPQLSPMEVQVSWPPYHFTHREIFSKSYYIKLKSDCNYHFPIDLETPSSDLSEYILFQIEKIFCTYKNQILDEKGKIVGFFL